jgi:hypothetical protein
MDTGYLSKLTEEIALDMDNEVLDLDGVDEEIASVEKVLATGAMVQVIEPEWLLVTPYEGRWMFQWIQDDSLTPVRVYFDNPHDAAKTFVETRLEHGRD